MKLQKESSIESTDRAQNNCENVSKPKIFTVNMETGKVFTEDKEEKEFNKEDILRNKKNGKTETASIRLLKIVKSESNSCGFHLTRTKWDPYPWVSAVDADTPAEISGLKVGDCILEVNGEDVLGLRITDIAKIVRAKSEHVTLLLWSPGCDSKCDPESLCDGPMPRSLQRLSIIVQSILSIIECPVCLDTIPPPAMQCQNGHLLCVNCRIRAEKCPVCRDRYTPRRALIAEQIYAAITNAFNLCRTEDKLRQKLFGTNVKLIQQQHQHQYQHQQEQQMIEQQKCEQQKSIVNMVKTSANKEVYPRALGNTMESLCRSGTEVCKSAVKANGNNKERIGLQLPTNKFLAKLLFSKACSMDNLSSTTATTTTTEATTQTQSTNSDGPLMSWPATPSTFAVKSFRTNSPLPVTSEILSTASNTTPYPYDTTNQLVQSCSNQLHNITTGPVTPNIEERINFVQENREEISKNLDDFAPMIFISNNITEESGTAKYFSSTENGFLKRKKNFDSTNSQLTTPAPDGFIMSTEVRPQCTPNSCDPLILHSPTAKAIEFPPQSFLELNNRPPRSYIHLVDYNHHNDSVES